MSYAYIHKAQYYETDKMGIIHHSNYIRWFEEARVGFLADVGYPFEELEAKGIVSPVLSVSCNYRKMVRFADTARIEVEVLSISSLKMELAYRIYLEGEEGLYTEGKTSHCFLDKDGRPISIRNHVPEFYNKLKSLTNTEKNKEVK